MTSSVEILPRLNVSCETIEKLKTYEALLLKWTKSINLISRQSEKMVWQRHILDSAQLFPLIPDTPGDWIDFGAGGGLPGVVLAILAVEQPSQRRLHLVESDHRKSAFLNHVCRSLDLNSVTVHTNRIDCLAPFPVALITARALASLTRLLEYSEPFISNDTTLLFLKGEKADSELTEAHRHWHSEAEVFESKTDPSGRILRLTNVRARNDG
ncbi:MAG: 16S rRNA (guanine(527)-N(7))-methyltransferase RsmG [Pseudomonadota bacterium]